MAYFHLRIVHFHAMGAASAPTIDRSDFALALARSGVEPLRRRTPTTMQVNVGKLCNQACHHCHVDAGPKRTERMTRATAERVLDVLARSPRIATVDITGGAPELNENFAMIVERARSLDREVIVRCNLTVTLEPGMEWLPEFYRDHDVALVCSLPCYTAGNVDRQRGNGVFDRSIAALTRLNSLGFGTGPLRLDLVYNPLGPSLPPDQAGLEATYREELGRCFGIRFDRLLTIANMPIERFARQLRTEGRLAEYMGLLVNHFNPATVDGLMCRDLVSIGWDGRLYDCDFNQMLEIPIGQLAFRTIWDIDDLSILTGAGIATAHHCFGCTAGAGSSCSGALA
jgi:radical SAM/Cys-rich protein